ACNSARPLARSEVSAAGAPASLPGGTAEYCVEFRKLASRTRRREDAWGRAFVLWSHLVGWGARLAVPQRLRPPAYRAFARATGAIDLEREAELPLADYRTFGDLFARKLRPGARPIDRDPAGIVCPCDGAIASAGTVERGTLVQAKGRSYSLAELVADDAL